MDITFRKATKHDTDRIMNILYDARASIGRLGIDQWQYGYPTRSVIIEDIEAGRSFAVDKEGEMVSTFALKYDGEVTYNEIYDGAWLGSGSYIALHRIAIDSPFRGSGIAEKIVEFISDECRRLNRESIRVDTHEGNIPMRKMLEKNGFSYCGIIYLGTGEARVAYEKIVMPNTDMNGHC